MIGDNGSYTLASYRSRTSSSKTSSLASSSSLLRHPKTQTIAPEAPPLNLGIRPLLSASTSAECVPEPSLKQEAAVNIPERYSRISAIVESQKIAIVPSASLVDQARGVPEDSIGKYNSNTSSTLFRSDPPKGVKEKIIDASYIDEDEQESQEEEDQDEDNDSQDSSRQEANTAGRLPKILSRLLRMINPLSSSIEKHKTYVQPLSIEKHISSPSGANGSSGNGVYMRGKGDKASSTSRRGTKNLSKQKRRVVMSTSPCEILSADESNTTVITKLFGEGIHRVLTRWKRPMRLLDIVLYGLQVCTYVLIPLWPSSSIYASPSDSQYPSGTSSILEGYTVPTSNAPTLQSSLYSSPQESTWRFVVSFLFFISFCYTTFSFMCVVEYHSFIMCFKSFDFCFMLSQLCAFVICLWSCLCFSLSSLFYIITVFVASFLCMLYDTQNIRTRRRLWYGYISAQIVLTVLLVYVNFRMIPNMCIYQFDLRHGLVGVGNSIQTATGTVSSAVTRSNEWNAWGFCLVDLCFNSGVTYAVLLGRMAYSAYTRAADYVFLTSGLRIFQKRGGEDLEKLQMYLEESRGKLRELNQLSELAAQNKMLRGGLKLNVLVAICPFIDLSPEESKMSLLQRVVGRNRFYRSWLRYRQRFLSFAWASWGYVWIVCFVVPLVELPDGARAALNALSIFTLLCLIVPTSAGVINFRVLQLCFKSFDAQFFIAQSFAIAFCFSSVFCFRLDGVTLSVSYFLGLVWCIVFDTYHPNARRKLVIPYTAILIGFSLLMLSLHSQAFAEETCYYRIDFVHGLVRDTQLSSAALADASSALYPASKDQLSSTTTDSKASQEQSSLWSISLTDLCFTVGFTLVIFMLRFLFTSVRHPRDCVILRSSLRLLEIPIGSKTRVFDKYFKS